MRQYAGDRPVDVVPNVVDVAYFAPPPVRPAPEPFVFLTVGHLTAIKGFDVLLKAFARQFGSQGAVRLHVGGHGRERPALEALCRDLGINGSVRFLGPMSREAVRAGMWEAHAFVSSSRHETFGVVLAEALATGLPVVATRCGGPEYIVAPNLGILVPPGDAPALADALGDMLVRHHEFGAHALRQSSEHRFGADAVAGALTGVYGRALHSYGRR
jgi:glycosyltransferase involved in cell wall biosynthesis